MNAGMSIPPQGSNALSPFLMLILSSPSGAGKTTLTRMIEKRFPELRFSVSHTTRAPRANEVDGTHYHFTDHEAFREKVRGGSFLEWAEVHGNYYGTSMTEIIRAEQDPSCSGIIFDIDFQGARQIRARIPDVVSIFILPPSMTELERRLRGRGSESEEAIARRFSGAKREIANYALFDYLVVNDQIDRAFETLASIIVAERARRSRRAGLAESLLRHDVITPTDPSNV
jgi:guanylate kinase